MNTNILQKTEELFWNNSFSDISMDEVAKNIWLKKASLYHHFNSKDDMFIQVLSYSYEKYIWYLNEIFELSNIKEIIEKLIKLPYENKNLFAIVLQKWYCHDEKIKKIILSKTEQIDKLFEEKLWKKYNINTVRLILLRWIIDDFGKKNCIISCPSSKDLNLILDEIVSIFFN